MALTSKKIEGQMTEEELANIGGGWYNANYDQVNYCPNCGNDDRNEVSRQFFASFFDLDGWTKFRCKKCNHY